MTAVRRRPFATVQRHSEAALDSGRGNLAFFLGRQRTGRKNLRLALGRPIGLRCPYQPVEKPFRLRSVLLPISASLKLEEEAPRLHFSSLISNRIPRPRLESVFSTGCYVSAEKRRDSRPPRSTHSLTVRPSAQRPGPSPVPSNSARYRCESGPSHRRRFVPRRLASGSHPRRVDRPTESR